MKWYWCIIFLFIVIFLPAQDNLTVKQQLLMQYLYQRDYEKALPLLEEVYAVYPDSWYQNYYDVLLAFNRYDDAEKITKSFLKKHPDRADIYVNWGHIYSLQQNTKKEKEYFDKAIKKLPNNSSIIVLTSKLFLTYNQVEYAMECYKKGKEVTGYPFNYEMAEIYQRTKDYKNLIGLYLDMLLDNPGELSVIQNQIQSLLTYNAQDTTQILQPILKQELIKKNQKYPDHMVFTDFLIFLLIQQNDYDNAFIQAKAADKRTKDEGLKVFQLGQTAANNKQFEVAQKCFLYVIQKGKQSPYYEAARYEYLRTKFMVINSSINPDLNESVQLSRDIQSYIKENIHSSIIYPLVNDLSDIYTKYLHRFDKSDSLLRYFIDNPNIKDIDKAIFKLKLADTYVFENKLWEAILLCMQVDKDFKYESVGQEAQFKRATIAFYSGEFKLAKAQADILKGATSKLIANDAMQLSIIISNALFSDTTGKALHYFAKADLLIFQNKLDDALIMLDSINQKFTEHSLEDDIFFKKAKIFEKKQDYINTEAMYLNILQYFPKELYADDAVFNLAQLYQYKLNNTKKAMEYYEKLLNDYPGSLYVPEARKIYRTLRGDVISQ